MVYLTFTWQEKERYQTLKRWCFGIHTDHECDKGNRGKKAIRAFDWIHYLGKKRERMCGQRLGFHSFSSLP